MYLHIYAKHVGGTPFTFYIQQIESKYLIFYIYFPSNNMWKIRIYEKYAPYFAKVE